MWEKLNTLNTSNPVTWTFNRFLNSLACLPPPNHVFSTLLKKKSSRVSLFCSCFLEKVLLVWHPLGHSLLVSMVWSENSSEQRARVRPCGVYNRVCSLWEHLRSIVKSMIYLERGCLFFRMAHTTLTDDRTHIARKVAAWHIEPCLAQDIQKFQSPTLLRYALLNFVVESFCKWTPVLLGITGIHKQTKVQKEIIAWAKGRMWMRGKKEESRIKKAHTWQSAQHSCHWENEPELPTFRVCEGAARLHSLCRDLYARDFPPAAAHCLLQDQTVRRWVRARGEGVGRQAKYLVQQATVQLVPLTKLNEENYDYKQFSEAVLRFRPFSI